MRWVSTTDSSTRCLRSTPPEPTRRRLLAGVLAAGVLAARPVWAQQTRAELTQLRLEATDDGIYLSAAVRFELPAAVSDVLDKGIALHFVAEAELFRERWYWTDQRIGQATRYMRLAYQPLMRRWRLNVSPTPITPLASSVMLGQHFDTLEEALDALRRIGRMRLADVGDVGEGGSHPVVFRFRLDTSQLPRPFQIGLVGQSDWNVSVERSTRLPLEPAR